MQGGQQIPTQWGDEKKTDNLGENGESFLSTFVRVNLSNLVFFYDFFMKELQIFWLTVKESLKSMNTVGNNSPINNTGFINELHSYFLPCIFQNNSHL